MSRVVKISGKVKVENSEIANEAIRESGVSGIFIRNGVFEFNEYDYNDGYGKRVEIEKVEKLYKQKLNGYLRKLEEETKRLKEQKRLAELKRIEEEKRRIEEERKRIEEEKRVYREEQFDKVIKNAEKQGYKLKKEVREDNTIKLVLQKRVY
ncbi:hypothetical protein ThvES_00019420 [Thiovulum sp. ES]|nr:hypothetical protein ThvES_00019420 [Thiovulum sp. ES]